ncbi:hypothetical protein FIBSPDRAFT_848361 [Athelia psychrophila]|uniref:Uncharacterized protein n=1 Tax=Athelia psychrophila TaxID=1759441 RepID=A0A166VBD8_9AGAM|nr:hypothetical protein FIBSPDRAFT_848361 [Fibularhizoctonia sp. CBS 109695]
MHRERCKAAQRIFSELSNDSLSPKDYSAVPNMLQRELQMRLNQITSIRRKYAFKEPLNVEINYTVFPFQITAGSAHFVPERYHQLAAQDREMIDKLGGTASRIPGSIIARYFYPAGDLQSRLGEIMILDPPKLMLYNMEGRLSEKYYSVRARKDNGSYEMVHQP